MKKVIIDCEKLNERKRAHRYLAEIFEFPDYYGKNLDALFDCLMELGECTIVLQGEETLRQKEGYAARILQVLEEAVHENPGLKLETQTDHLPEQENL